MTAPKAQQPPAHTPGPLQAVASLSRWNVITVTKPRTLNICAVNTDRIEQEGNARLLAAAYTSYDKHCGPRAVECAEADLLGEALAALRDLSSALPKYNRDEWRTLAEANDRARAVLAKASGGSGT